MSKSVLVTDDNEQYTQESQDRLLASAIRFLIDGGDIHEAQMLVTSDVWIYADYDDWGNEFDRITLRCARATYDVLKGFDSRKNFHAKRIEEAFSAVVGDRGLWFNVSFSTDSVDMSDGWRERLQELILRGGSDANNQGLSAESSPFSTTWNGLKFGSKAEKQVALALEKRAAMYFPLCAARLGQKNSRKRKEPDFLVCHRGKWGILEVDGERFHAGRAAEDHERDRLFKYHGVKVVEHYDSEECRLNPDKVVSDFLNLVDRLQ